ncbi:MAG: oligosaccharide flippase family protein, partial [bacterium]
MSDIKTLVKQASHYFTGNTLSLLAGFISFPILTRVFTVSDYGIMNLISITLVFVTALCKLGINKGAARFYEEFNSGKRKSNPNTFQATFFWGGVFLSGGITLIYLLSIKSASFFVKNNYIINLFYLTVLLVWFRSISAILLSLLNAAERSKLYSLIIIVHRYITLTLSIFLTFYFIKGLQGYYIGIIIAELIVVSFLVVLYLNKINPRYFSLSFLKESLQYGLPLIAFELAGVFLTKGDTYQLQYFKGSAEVGLYSAGYNLCTYCSQLIIMPLILAIYPVYMKIWITRGKDETTKFLNRLLSYFLMLAIPIIFGIWAIGKEAITVLASSKYSSAHIILPIILTGMFLDGCSNILG